MQSKNKKRIKLAYVVTLYSPEFGGPWHNLMLELSKYVDVYCISQPQIFSKRNNPDYEEINPHFKVYRFKSKKFKLRRELMVPDNLDKILDEIKPDIVQSDEFFRFTTTQAYEWAKRNSVPFILCSRMKYREGFIRNLAIKVFSLIPSMRKAVKNSFKIISTQGECSKKEFLRWFPRSYRKFEIIPSGINIEEFKDCKREETGLPKNKKIILNISRVDTMKRLPLLISAFAKINSKIPESILLHIGAVNDLKEFNKIKKEIRKKELEEKVIFLESVPNNLLGNYYNTADVFVNTSVGEGICFSFLESMVFGVPIVAFDQGGNYCAVSSGKNGFLIKNDNLEEFSNKVIEILKNSSLRKKLSEGAKERVSREFDIKKNAIKYVKVYRDSLGERNKKDVTKSL